MYKEKFIAGNYPFTKAELVKLRQGGEYKAGVDYELSKKSNGVPVILWTEAGLKRLLDSKGISFNGRIPDLQSGDEGSIPSVSTEPKKVASKSASEEKVYVPAIVKQKYPNKRLVRCEVRGQAVNVLVRDSSILRVNSIILVIHRGGRWVGNFKVGSNGRIHAS